MKIIDLKITDGDKIDQAAALLFAGFQEHWPEAWPDMESALEEVRNSLEPGRISRIAQDSQGIVMGWIGGISIYDGHVWELHPLVVAPDRQGQGIGRALVEDLENIARKAGVWTLFLGSDDMDQMTSLAGADLYSDIPGYIAGIENRKGHPFEFYQRLGFTIIGILPDANGPGKPDILMAKRLRFD
jgi:aminoglycoside 6'-N-acetyltransferase I